MTCSDPYGVRPEDHTDIETQLNGDGTMTFACHTCQFEWASNSHIPDTRSAARGDQL